ncbi:hypothetical protein D3C79_789000 [compost metagenome]
MAGVCTNSMAILNNRSEQARAFSSRLPWDSAARSAFTLINAETSQATVAAGPRSSTVTVLNASQPSWMTIAQRCWALETLCREASSNIASACASSSWLSKSSAHALKARLAGARNCSRAWSLIIVPGPSRSASSDR